jgi:hypothetical protein
MALRTAASPGRFTPALRVYLLLMNRTEWGKSRGVVWLR